MRVPPKPPLHKQDVPIAPRGIYVVSVTGEKQPVAWRYAGKDPYVVHQRESVSEYRKAEVFRVGMEADGGWMPPLSSINVRIRP